MINHSDIKTLQDYLTKYLMRESRIVKAVHIWSDGGQPFKSYRSEYEQEQSVRSENINASRAWFDPNHGKSLADAHAGVLKGHLRTWRTAESTISTEYCKDIIIHTFFRYSNS